MADPVLFDDVATWFGGVDLSRAIDRASLILGRQELASSRMGDKAMAAFPGGQVVPCSIGGHYAAGAGEPESILASRVLGGDRTIWPVTFLPPWAPAETPGADGNIGYNVRVAQDAFRFGGQHGQILPFELNSRSRSGGGMTGLVGTMAGVERVTIVLPKALRTVTATGVGRQLGLLNTGFKLVSVVHLFAITGGSLTVTIESDNAGGFGTPVTRITHTAMTTAPNREIKELAGPVATDDFWRAVATYTPGTNFTVAVALAIEPA